MTVYTTSINTQASSESWQQICRYNLLTFNI